MTSDRRMEAAVTHFYDLTCPFCYVAQPVDLALERTGASVTHLPFRAHPEIPPAGLYLGPRHGAMYDQLEEEARVASLPLHWPPRLPPSRLALASAEWVRVNQPEAADMVRRTLFAAHFSDGLDIADRDTVLGIIVSAGADASSLSAALDDGSADDLLLAAEASARRIGVTGTPAWNAHGRTVIGFRPAAALSTRWRERWHDAPP